MELGHLYTVVTREDDEPGPITHHASTFVLRRNYGYQALVHARRTLATAKVRSNNAEVGFEVIMCLCAQVILLVCHGVLKGRERRSGCCGDCHSRRDIRLISCVWPLPGAEWALVSCPKCSRQYDRAMEVAVAAHCGVLEIGPSMAAQGAMPWSLKEAFLSGQTAVLFSCLVTNSPQFLNESHLRVHGSFIAGAGQFLEKNENEIEGRLTKIEKALDAQKDEDTKNKWTATCRKARREVEMS